MASTLVAIPPNRCDTPIPYPALILDYSSKLLYTRPQKNQSADSKQYRAYFGAPESVVRDV
jgi:hypothetical protein